MSCDHIVGYLPSTYDSSSQLVEMSDDAYESHLAQDDFELFAFCPKCGAAIIWEREGDGLITASCM